MTGVFTTKKQGARRRHLATTLAVMATLALAGCSSGPSASSDSGAGTSAASSAAGGGESSTGTTGTSPTPTPDRNAPHGSAKWTRFPVSVGRAFVTKYTGEKSGVRMKVHVWLPPQYSDPAYAGKKFPVLVAFPGGAGASGAVWFSHGVPEAITKGAKAGTVTPFIVVQPQMQLSEGLDTECTDLAGQPKVGTFLDTDVPNLIKSSLDVIGDRSGWATTGVSSGGYCSAKVTMSRPETFSVGAPIDGYFVIDANVAAGKTAAAKATSPIEVAKTNPPDVTMRSWYGTGFNNGDLSKARSHAFAAAVKPPTKFSEKEIPGGAHSWTTYTKILPEVLTWLTGVVAAPQ